MRFNCLRATESLRGDSLRFTTNPTEIPGTHFIKLGGPTSGFESSTPGLRLPSTFYGHCFEKSSNSKMTILITWSPFEVHFWPEQ